MSWSTLKSFEEDLLSKGVASAAAKAGHHNVFNVSLLKQGEFVHAVYRAFAEGQRKPPFRAFVLLLSESGSAIGEPWELGADVEDFDHDVVADPKLFEARGRLFATYNTGFTREGDNKIYVRQIYPSVGPPQECVLAGGRNRIEKNWGFYETATGDLRILYDLSAGTLLEVAEGDLGAGGPLTLRRCPVSAITDAGLSGLSLGTQPTFRGNNGVLIAHQKLSLAGRRLYCGRPVKLTDDGQSLRVEVSKRRLVHSLRDALPQRGNHNPNLISATYFAGAQLLNDEQGSVRLSYGINDKTFAVARVNEEWLWK